MGELAKIESWRKDIALIETIEEAKLINDALINSFNLPEHCLPKTSINNNYELDFK
jgi:hypothetical protein